MVGRSEHSRRRGPWAFGAAVAVSTAGVAISLLSATGITTSAGQMNRGALYTGVYLATGLLAGALCVPYGPRLAHRWGTRRAFLRLTEALTALWLVGGALILLGASALVTILVMAPVLGALTALAAVLAPIVYKAYLSSADVASAVATMSVVKGGAFALGALAGGLLLVVGAEAWGLIVVGLTKIPLILLLHRCAPTSALAEPRDPGNPWRDIRHGLATSVQLRRGTFLACGAALFLSPVTILVVPITQSLRQEPLYQGAGLLMTAFAVGQILSPRVARRLRRGRALLRASMFASLSSGIFLFALGATSVLISFRIELLAWIVLAIGFGMFRYAARALTIGATAEAQGAANAAKSISAMLLIAGLVAPIGTLGWSFLIGQFSAYAAVITSGVGIGVVALALMATDRPALDRDSDPIPRSHG